MASGLGRGGAEVIAVRFATSLDLATITEGDTTYTVALYAGRLWVRDDSNEPVRADVLEAIEAALREQR